METVETAPVAFNYNSVRGTFWNVQSNDGGFTEVDLILDRAARAHLPKPSLSPRSMVKEVRQRPLYKVPAISSQSSRSLVRLRSCTPTPAWGVEASWADDGTDDGNPQRYDGGSALEKQRSSSLPCASRKKGDSAMVSGKKTPSRTTRRLAAGRSGCVIISDARHDLPQGLRSCPSRPVATSSFYSSLRTS